MLASLVKALTPFGVVRLLLRLRALPLCPEQAAFEVELPPEQQHAWLTSVRRDVGPRGGAGRELRAVLPRARQAQRSMDGIVQPQFGDLPLGVLSSHAWGDKWVDTQRDLATRSHTSTHRISTTAATTSTCSTPTRWSRRSATSWSPWTPSTAKRSE